MPRSEQEGSLARRMRALEEEERALRQSMKDVNRRMRKLERGQPVDVPERREFAWQGAAAQHAPASTAPVEAVNQPMDEPLPAAIPPPGSRRLPSRGSDRFANYFAGHFQRGEVRPLNRERKIQRNKAIFMVLFVVLVGYLVYRMIF